MITQDVPHPPYTPPEVPTGTTGSEPEPEPTTPPQPPARPAVATEGSACWYVIGQGYSWGARPSGGETTGLNQSDCMAIQANYNAVRGVGQIPTKGGQTVQNVTNPQSQQTSETAYNPNAPMAPQERPSVATPGVCPEGQFWDGRQCRGSVASIPNLPGGFGGTSASGAGIGPGDLPGGGSEGLTAFGMTGRVRRFRVVNL